jgi:lipopolysaccharide transport system permease protein
VASTTAFPPTDRGASDIPVQVLSPASGWVPVHLGELWDYRELVAFLVWRDIKVRYKQTALGVAWAVIQPFITMVVFSVFFGRLAKMPSDGAPYPVFTFSALLPWQLFSYALTESSNSVVVNQRLLTKVYFPRLIMPLAAVSVGLADFTVSVAVLGGMLAYYGIAPGLSLLTIPLWALFAVVSALSVGIWLSALNVKYRDIRHTLPFLAQVWLIATPVAYSSSIVPARWRPLYALNPMVGVVDGFRWAVLGQGQAPGLNVAISAAAVAALLVTGLFYFRRMERTFADVV